MLEVKAEDAQKTSGALEEGERCVMNGRKVKPSVPQQRQFEPLLRTIDGSEVLETSCLLHQFVWCFFDQELYSVCVRSYTLARREQRPTVLIHLCLSLGLANTVLYSHGSKISKSLEGARETSSFLLLSHSITERLGIYKAIRNSLVQSVMSS